MNKAAMNLCMDNQDLLRNKNKLTKLARKAIHESGYQYKKKASRSKQFGQGDEKKRQYVSDAIKTQRLQEINEDLGDTNTQISLLTRQREKHVNVKQFGLAANVTEQISQLRGKKRKLEQELTLLQQKRKECQRQKTRVCTAKETSATQTTKITAFAVPSATTSLKQDDDEKETPRETVSKGPEDITLGPILPKQDLRSSQEIQGDAEEQAEKPSTTTNKIDSSDHFIV